MPSRRAVLVALGLLSLTPAACGTRLDEARVQADANVDLVDPGSGTLPSTTASLLPASDVGVSPTEITIGIIVSETSPLGAETFSHTKYGVLAFFEAQNARGGINGRQVRVVVCDDTATGAGNRRCVRSLVDDEKVFAFVGNSVFNYAGAEYVNDHGVTDMGGVPINNAYDQYSHLFNVYGSNSPRNGEIGFDGVLADSTEVYRWFKERLDVRVAAVVAYNQSDSLRYANLITAGLEAEGFEVVREQVDFAVPNFEAVAIDLRARGVEIVVDAMDVSGNVALCRAMDGIGYTVTAKIASVESWRESVRSDYASAPRCRESIFVTARTRNYMDTDHPMVARAREEIRQAFPDREDRMSMWTLEGWGSALWFTDAATSCGADLTRSCVEAFLNRPEGYDASGLFDLRVFEVVPPGDSGSLDCLTVAQWRADAYGGEGGWVTHPDGEAFVCYDAPNIAYRP